MYDLMWYKRYTAREFFTHDNFLVFRPWLSQWLFEQEGH